MRIETSIEQEQERLDFAKRAAEMFARHPEWDHYSLGEFAPGDLMAFRRDGGVLVVRLGHEPFVHYQGALRQPDDDNVELVGMVQPEKAWTRRGLDWFSVPEGVLPSEHWNVHDHSSKIPKGLHAGQWAYVRLVNGNLWVKPVTDILWADVTHYIRAQEPGGPPVRR